MRRKFYINSEQASTQVKKLPECCLFCGTRVADYIRRIPAQYIAVPPFKRFHTPDGKSTLPTEETLGRICERGCSIWTQRPDASPVAACGAERSLRELRKCCAGQRLSMTANS